MRAIRRAKLAALAVAALAVPTGLVAATAGVAQAATYYGCPDGYACIYPTGSWTTPEHKYYDYGTYKLYDEYGTHKLFNHQSGGAIMWICTDSNGKNCPYYIPTGSNSNIDLTPYNSIKLVPSL